MIDKSALKWWLLVLAGLLFIIAIVLSFASGPQYKTAHIYTTVYKNAKPLDWFIDDCQISIDDKGYATFKIYVGDKIDYANSWWNFCFVPEYAADYLKEMKIEK